MLEMLPEVIVAVTAEEAGTPDHRSRLNVMAMSALSFCAEPETWSVFKEWYAKGYDETDPEAAEQIRGITRDGFIELSFAFLTLIDPESALEMVKNVAEGRKP